MDMREWQEMQKRKKAGSANPGGQQSSANNIQQQSGSNHRHNQKRQGSGQSRPMNQGRQQNRQNNNRPVSNNDLFHNPYHFVPVETQNRIDDLCMNLFRKGETGHVTHDRYKDGALSGRIICRLETITPIFIGADHKTDRAITPFEVEKNIPAIPASSLRGLISSIAEAASNSALRVLEDRPFSRRLYMREALQAIGILEKDSKTGNIMLRPLVMPALRCDNDAGANARLGKYAKIFTKPALKVYLDGYKTKPGSNPPELEKKPISFLDTRNPNSYSSDNMEFWYMQLGTSSMGTGANPVVTCANSNVKTIGNSYYLNGQKPNSTLLSKPEIIDQTTYDGLSSVEKNSFTKGILRVLGLGVGDCRAKEMPGVKKHEIFIPYDPSFPASKLLDVTEALQSFHELAETRTEFDPATPFELKGSNRSSSGGGPIELREGDLVFFDIDNSGNAVRELAISSIWRRWIDGSCHDFFRGISKELLPFSSKRDVITIAEQMFGFVSEQEEKDSDQKALALKGRIRFSNGLMYSIPEDGCYLPEDTLKILDSPKPPSPNLYFNRKDGQGNSVYIPKFGDNTLSYSKGDRAQGRKMYLHHPNATANQPWKTAPGQENTHADQKSKITPVKKDLSFYFHIDFDNLTRRELSLLCYALVPNENFMHKIGMGKPIGLGSVKIDSEGILLINRLERYSAEAFKTDRYHQSWTNGKEANWPEERYGEEKKCASLGGIESIGELAAEFPVNSDIKKAIDLLGTMPLKNVHYPQVENGDPEDKLFQWFVANDTGSGRGRNKIQAQKEVLKPITRDSSELPSLKRYPWNG